MVDWSHGYDVSLGYTYGFFPEMAPAWLDFCSRVAGNEPPRRGADGQFRYLELGVGQGLNLCLMAAANPQGEFVGVDFHPEHIAHAEGLAAAAGLTNIRFVEADFIDLADRWPDDFGTFDYVTLHGIFSWVPPQVRAAAIRCVSHATRPGAIVYSSYNAQPGWLTGMPFRHISHRLKATTGRSGRQVVDESIALFEKMGAANAAIFKAQPGLQRRIQEAKTKDGAYLVQEYLNDSWSPFWHSEIAGELQQAKLGYVGPATIVEALMPAILSAPFQEILAAQSDPTLRQDIQDLLINQTFRRDIYCRGKRRSVGHDIRGGTRLHLIFPPEPDKAIDIHAAFGTQQLEYPLIAGIVEALREGPKSLAELGALPAMREKGWRTAIQILLQLMQARVVGLEAADRSDDDAAHRLNAAIARDAFHGLPYRHIAAPRLGSAIGVSTTELLLIDTWFQLPDKTDGDALARAAATRLTQAGREFVHDGKVLTGAALEQRMAEKARDFLDEKLPRWRGLGALP